MRIPRLKTRRQVRHRLTIYRAPDGIRWRFADLNTNILSDGGQGYSDFRDAAHGAAVSLCLVRRPTTTTTSVLRYNGDVVAVEVEL